MVRMIMHGCNGAMGQVITGLAADDKDIEIVAGIDLRQGTDCGYPVFTSLGECNVSADVIVDFASAKAVDGLLKFSAETGTPVVLCTTGLSQEQLAAVKRTSASAAVLRSANMSLGVNLLLKLVKDAAKVLAGSGFDIEIVEKHHNQKMDAPSGTAIALADSINQAMDMSYGYTYDRSTRREKRHPSEIGISAIIMKRYKHSLIHGVLKAYLIGYIIITQFINTSSVHSLRCSSQSKQKFWLKICHNPLILLRNRMVEFIDYNIIKIIFSKIPVM